MKPALLLPILLLLLLLSGSNCIKQPAPYFNGTGKKPVYISAAALLEVHNEPPRSIQQSGTIFLQDTLLFIVEQGLGIHVFDIRDSSNTVNLTFLHVPAITDFTISGHNLYASCWKDLVTIDIGDVMNIHEVSRITGALTPPLYPLQYQGYFECVDETKGAVTTWQDTVLENARCFTL